MTDGIGCFDYPFCTREHAGGTGGVPVHPPAGSRVSGSDGPLIPDEPAAASTGDWWGEAKEAVADAIDPSDERINRYWSASRALAAVLPLFVAEATRRIAAAWNNDLGTAVMNYRQKVFYVQVSRPPSRAAGRTEPADNGRPTVHVYPAVDDARGYVVEWTDGPHEFSVAVHADKAAFLHRTDVTEPADTTPAGFLMRCRDTNCRNEWDVGYGVDPGACPACRGHAYAVVMAYSEPADTGGAAMSGDWVVIYEGRTPVQMRWQPSRARRLLPCPRTWPHDAHGPWHDGHTRHISDLDAAGFDCPGVVRREEQAE